MDPSLNNIAVNLLEAVITLYPADDTGAPILSQPILSGAAAENLNVRANWLNRETRPTGAPYPKQHPFIPQYEISIGRIWALPTAALTGFAADYTHYVLDVIWTDEETQLWHRRTFYGVTIREQGLTARDIESGIIDEQSWMAEYAVPSASASPTPPPAISSTVPLLVYHTDATGHTVLLYSYDNGTKQYTAVADTTSRATVSYVSNQFSVQFAQDSEPVVVCTASNDLNYQNPDNYQNNLPYRSGLVGMVVQGDLLERAPTGVEVPRLDFYYGLTRVCSITRTGFYSPSYGQVTSPADGANKFTGNAGSTLVATFEPGKTSAVAFILQ